MAFAAARPGNDEPIVFGDRDTAAEALTTELSAAPAPLQPAVTLVTDFSGMDSVAHGMRWLGEEGVA
eukprot:885790-Alexandrium_andersonii.AAC.1